jgi:hypothetical protein
VRRLSTNRPPQSVKSPVHSPSELWNAFGACGGLMVGVKCHSRLPTSSNYVVHRGPTPGGPGSGLRPGRKRFLRQLPLWFYIGRKRFLRQLPL